MKDIKERIYAEELSPSDNGEQNNATDADWLVPHGLVGDMARFFYSSAIKPVKEVALAATIGYSAALLSRAFKITRTGQTFTLPSLQKAEEARK